MVYWDLRSARWAIPALAAIALAIILRVRDRSQSNVFPAPTWDRGYVAPRVISQQELSEKYNGKGGNQAYLVILGEIFDVSGSEHYAENSGYSIFVGRDATTAFVTGKFDDSAGDDILPLQAAQMKGIEDWVKFYRTHQTYKFVGVLEGRYYGSDGRRTRQWDLAKAKIDDAEKEIARKEAETRKLPSCNSRWSQTEGTALWCEDSMLPDEVVDSPLVPRRIESEGASKCVCVRWSTARSNPNTYQTYDGCTGGDQRCDIKS